MDEFSLFRTPSAPAREYFCYSDGLGWIDAPGFRIDRGEFINGLMMHVVSGAMIVEQNGRHRTGAGETVVLRLTERHCYYSDPVAGCTFYWIHFGGKPAETLLRFMESFGPLPRILPLEGVPDAIRACGDLYARHDIEGEIEASAHIRGLLEQAARLLVRSDPARFLDPRDMMANRVVQYLESRWSEPIRLDDLAELFNLSRWHFCRVFRQTTGRTPADFVLDQKIQRAKTLLAWTGDSLSDIAGSLGFSDPSHFARTFRKRIGYSPSAYRRHRIHG